MSAEPLMFTIWIRNDATGEATQIKGQGAGVPEAMKDGWENAIEDFRTSSSGAPPVSRSRLCVTLPSGGRVFRRPEKFASRVPYDDATEREIVPSAP